jgi:hypothetical protein
MFVGFRGIKSMNKPRSTRFIVALAAFLASFFIIENARADNDRDATPEERARVVKALQAEGCPSVSDVDYIEGTGFVADVVCNDGKEYDISLDDNMNIISRREDRD